MGRKKKEAVRCHSCGVKATRHVVGDLYVCDNTVCDLTVFDYMKMTVEQLKQREVNVKSN